jgi:glycosyltransferase involved in cell wall biosynthesis
MMSKKPRVLFIAATHTQKSGGERSNFELVKAARKHGYEPCVVLPDKGDIAAELQRLKITHTVIPYYWWRWGLTTGIEDAGLINFMAVGQIARFANEQRVEAVITNTLNVPWGAWVAAITNLPHVWVARENSSGQFSYLEDKFDFIGKFSNLVIANSQEVAKDIQQMPDCHNVDYFYSYVDVTKLKVNENLSRTRLVVVADIHKHKNQLELLKAYSLLPQPLRAKVEVVVIGDKTDPDYAVEIDKFLESSTVKNRIHFTGRAAEPYSLIGPNDIMVQPSVAESLGRFMTEAMKLGLICVGADIPGTSEAFRLGGGTVYKSGDPQSLAKVLEKVLTDLPAYKKQAAQAQARALQNLSEEASSGKFFKSIQTVLGEPNRRAELRHFADYFMNFAELAQQHKELVIRYDQSTRELIQKVEAMEGSRAWRLSLKLKKMRGKLKP